MVYLTRKTTFCAGHRYYRPELSEDGNFRLFGKCSYPNGHGHNYTLEVTIKGDVDPKTGMVMNLTGLDAILKKNVVELLDHRFLNSDIAHFRKAIPTTENLTLFIWDIIVDSFESCSLHRVRLFETDDLYAEYYGE